jgi:hypothetical protein
MNNTDNKAATKESEEKDQQQSDNSKSNTKTDEEESLVLLQFTDLDDANYSQQFSSQLKSIDISSANPIIQIGNRLYSGEYTNNLGTYLFFEEKDKSATTAATVTKTTSTNQFDYSGKSFKKLVLTRLFVEEQRSSANSPKSAASESEADCKDQ